MEETETDVDILLECLKCRKKDFQGMKRSLLALASVFNSDGDSKEYFRKVGGLQLVYKLIFTKLPDPVLQAAVFCLACAVENDVFCQNVLTKPETFDFLHKVLSEKKENKWLHAAVFLLLNLVAGNGAGQRLAKESSVVADLMGLFRHYGGKSQQNSGVCQDELELWSSVVTALSMCVNNPQNEENQRLCSTVLPLCFQIVAEDRWRSVCLSLLSFAGLTVAGNGYNQNRVRKCGGLDTLLQLLQYCEKAVENDISVMQTTEGIISVINTCITDNEENAQHFMKQGGVQTVMQIISQPVELATHAILQLMLTLGHALEFAQFDREIAALAPQYRNTLVQLLAKTGDEEVVRAVKYVLNTWQNLGEGKEQLCKDTSRNMVTVTERIQQLSSELGVLDHDVQCRNDQSAPRRIDGDGGARPSITRHQSSLQQSPLTSVPPTHVLTLADAGQCPRDTCGNTYPRSVPHPSPSPASAQPVSSPAPLLQPQPPAYDQQSQHYPASVKQLAQSSAHQSQDFSSSGLPISVLFSKPGASTLFPQYRPPSCPGIWCPSGSQSAHFSKSSHLWHQPKAQQNVEVSVSSASHLQPSAYCLPQPPVVPLPQYPLTSNVSVLAPTQPLSRSASLPSPSQLLLPSAFPSLPLTPTPFAVPRPSASQSVSTTVTFPHLLAGPKYTLAVSPPQPLSQCGISSLRLPPSQHVSPPLSQVQDTMLLTSLQPVTNSPEAVRDSKDQQEWMAFQYFKKSLSKFLATGSCEIEDTKHSTGMKSCSCIVGECADTSGHNCYKHSTARESATMTESHLDGSQCENSAPDMSQKINEVSENCVKQTTYFSTQTDGMPSAEIPNDSKDQGDCLGVSNHSLDKDVTNIQTKRTNTQPSAAGIPEYMLGCQTCMTFEPAQISFDKILPLESSGTTCHAEQGQELTHSLPSLNPSGEAVLGALAVYSVANNLEHSAGCNQEKTSGLAGPECLTKPFGTECHIDDRGKPQNDADDFENAGSVGHIAKDSYSCQRSHTSFSNYKSHSPGITMDEKCSCQCSIMPGEPQLIADTTTDNTAMVLSEKPQDEILCEISGCETASCTSSQKKTGNQVEQPVVCDTSGGGSAKGSIQSDIFRVPFPRQTTAGHAKPSHLMNMTFAGKLPNHAETSVINQTPVRAGLRRAPMRTCILPQNYQRSVSRTVTPYKVSKDEVPNTAAFFGCPSEDSVAAKHPYQKTLIEVPFETLTGKLPWASLPDHDQRFSSAREDSNPVVPPSPAASEFDFQLLKTASSSHAQTRKHPKAVLVSPMGMSPCLESHHSGMNVTRKTPVTASSTLVSSPQTGESGLCHSLSFKSQTCEPGPCELFESELSSPCEFQLAGGDQADKSSGIVGGDQADKSSGFVGGDQADKSSGIVGGDQADKSSGFVGGELVPDSDVSDDEMESTDFLRPCLAAGIHSSSFSVTDSRSDTCSTVSEVYSILKDSLPSPQPSVCDGKHYLCPGCRADETLNSRTFNIALETSIFTCPAHRRVRQIERDFIANRASQLRLRKKLDYHLWKEQLKIRKQTSEKTLKEDQPVKKKTGSSLFDFHGSGSDRERVSPAHFEPMNKCGETTIHRKPYDKRRRKRIAYTDEEVSHLLQGIQLVGKHWQQILNTYSFHPSRTAVDLKDKYKQMQKQTNTSKVARQSQKQTLAMCEERRLRRGVAKFGHNWKVILQSGRFAVGRTAEELRERWRVLSKQQ